MSGKQSGVRGSRFLLITGLFWASVLVAIVLWKPVYHIMSQFMPMHSEYSLIEQATKFILLIMMAVSIMAYRNEEDSSKVKLSITCCLFAVAMYFSESNFIEESWQPMFGAVFILVALWQLLKTDVVALLFLLCGCTAIVMGMAGDMWSDHPEMFGDRSAMFDLGRVLYSMEEQMDLWGVAFIVYACLFVFRGILTAFTVRYPANLILLFLSAGLVAAGNGFAHWQYHPGQILTAAATVMALTGLVAMVLVTERQSGLELQFGFFDKSAFYRNCFLLFLVLPVIYGGVGGALNLILWASIFVLAGRYLYKNNPHLIASSRSL